VYAQVLDGSLREPVNNVGGELFTIVHKCEQEDSGHEHIEALAHLQLAKARWVLIRGYWSVGVAVVAQAPVSLMKLVVELWRAAN